MVQKLEFQSSRLILTVFLVQILFFYANTSSFAIVLLLSTLLFELPHLSSRKFWNVYKLPRAFILVSLIIIIPSILIAISTENEIFTKKFILSYLIFMFLLSIYYSRRYITSYNSMRIYVFFMNLIMVINFTGLGSLFYIFKPKQIFPFTEVSHFAIFYIIPAIFILPTYRLRSKFLTLFILLITLVQNESVTLLAVIIILFVMMFNVSRLVKSLLIVSILGVLFFYIIELTYFASRLQITSSSKNLSVLVYLSGLQSVQAALLEAPFGFGVQGLGIIHVSEIANFLCLEHYFCANKYDGGFTFAKIVSEFGYLGLILCFFILLRGLQAVFIKPTEFDLRNNLSKSNVVFSVVCLALFVELFVRGIGYFSMNLIIAFCLYYNHRDIGLKK